MAKLTKHEDKHGREGDIGEGCTIGFPVLGNTQQTLTA